MFHDPDPVRIDSGLKKSALLPSIDGPARRCR